MNRLEREIQVRDDPYQSIIVLCHDCKHVSLQVWNDDKTYTCPCCGSNMKEVKV